MAGGVRESESSSIPTIARPLLRLGVQETGSHGSNVRRRVAVVRQAQDVLHLDDGGVIVLAKFAGVAALEDFHRVTQLFAEDAHLVERFTIAGGVGGGFEFAQKLCHLRAGQGRAGSA